MALARLLDRVALPRLTSSIETCSQATGSANRSAGARTREYRIPLEQGRSISTAQRTDQWSQVPETLGKATILTNTSQAVQWLLVMAPSLFLAIGFAILAISDSATAGNDFGRRLEAAIKLGPTLFPLIFIAVAASSLKALCRYVCQQGIRLETVELLFASRSVWGTIESQLRLRRCTLVGAQLLLFWSLSPIGGQASLRALVKREQVTRNATQLRYLYTGPFSTFLASNKPSSATELGILLSVLSTSYQMKIAPSDNWGNVRVPRLDRLPPVNQRSDSAWHLVPAISAVEQLSSLVGVPVIGLPGPLTRRAADFSLETSYMSLECAAWESFSERAPRAEQYKKLYRGCDPLRIRQPETNHDRTRDINNTFFVDGNMPVAVHANASAVEADPRIRRLFFASVQSRSNDSDEFTLSGTQCNVTEAHVEVAVHCPAGSSECRATRMRRSLVDKRPEYGSPLDYLPKLQFITKWLPQIESSGGEAASSCEIFLRDSARSLPAHRYLNMSEVPPSLFASRLMLVLNAWYQISQTNGPVHWGGAPKDISAFGFDFGKLPANGSVPQSVVDASCRDMCTRSAEAVLTHTFWVYSYHPVWLALLFASSGVLLLAGLAGIVIQWRTCAPDVLGYAASMTYNNKYLPLPQHGGELDAMRRARVLRDLPISIGDVEGDDEAVGRIAFTALTSVRPLTKGRKYT